MNETPIYQNGNGFLLDKLGREFLLKKMPMTKQPNFTEALESLCKSMGLSKGTIIEEGQMTACPVHYTYASQDNSYATQIVGTVLGTSREVVCNLLVVYSVPVLKSKTLTYVGHWDHNYGDWVFNEE